MPNSQPQFPLDSVLESCSKLIDFNINSMNETADILKSASPVNDLEQVTHRLKSFYSEINWTNVITQTTNTKLMGEFFSELSEINQAALKGLTKIPGQMVESTAQSVQDYIQSTQSGTPTENIIPKQVDAYIDYVTKVKEETGHHIGFIDSIADAYNAWMQKSVQSLSQAS